LRNLWLPSRNDASLVAEAVAVAVAVAGAAVVAPFAHRMSN